MAAVAQAVQNHWLSPAGAHPRHPHAPETTGKSWWGLQGRKQHACMAAVGQAVQRRLAKPSQMLTGAHMQKLSSALHKES
jgi:hypothetical protein